MKCKYCGADIPEWLDFCPSCAKPVEAEQPAEEAVSQPEFVPEDDLSAVQVSESETERSAEQTAEPEQEPAPAKEKKKKKQKAEPEAEVYQSPERPRRSRRKKKSKGGASPFLWFLSGLLFCIAAVAALMLAGVLQRGSAVSAPGEETQVIREQGFESPEAVLQAYAAALRDGDLDGLLSTYSVSAYYAHVPDGAIYDTDFENGNNFMVWSAAEAELHAAGTPLSQAVAAEKTRGYLVDTIMNQYTYPLFHNNTCYTYDEDSAQSLILLKSEEDLQDYLAQLPNAKPFSKVEIGSAFEVSDKLSEEAAETYREYMQTVASNFRAEAAAFYYMELTIDGEEYLLGMELVQYEGLWYNNGPYNYGVNFKDEFANNNFGGLIPVAAISEWQ